MRKFIVLAVFACLAYVAWAALIPPVGGGGNGGNATNAIPLLNGAGTNTDLTLGTLYPTNRDATLNGGRILDNAVVADNGGLRYFSHPGDTNWNYFSFLLGTNPTCTFITWDRLTRFDGDGGGGWAMMGMDARHGANPSVVASSEWKVVAGGRIALVPAGRSGTWNYGVLQFGGLTTTYYDYVKNSSNCFASGLSGAFGANKFGFSGAHSWEAFYTDGSSVGHSHFPSIYAFSSDSSGTYSLRMVGELNTGSDVASSSDVWTPATAATPILEAVFTGAGVPSYFNLPIVTHFGSVANSTFKVDPAFHVITAGDQNFQTDFRVLLSDGTGNPMFQVGPYHGIAYFSGIGLHIGSAVGATAGMGLEIVGGNSNAAIQGTWFMTNGYTSYATNIGVANLTAGFTNSTGTNGRHGTNDMWCLITATSGTLTYYHRSGAGGQTACGIASAARTLTASTFPMLVGVNCGFTIASPVGVTIEPYSK